MVRVKPSSFGLSPSHHPLELQMPCLPLAQVTGDLCRFTLWCTNRRASDRNQKSFIGGEIIHENYEQSPSTENGLEWLLSSKPGQCDCQIRFVFLPTTASLLVHDALALVQCKKESSSWRRSLELRVGCWRRWRVVLRSYCWGGLCGKNGWLILLGFACATIAARPRWNWTWLMRCMLITHRMKEPWGQQRSMVTYHLGTWNLASCKLCSSIITLYCSEQMLAMGTGSLRWQSVQRLTGFDFSVTAWLYILQEKTVTSIY